MVYSAPCNECLQAYIGQTGRSLDHHIVEHWRAPRNGDVAALALAEHVFHAGHKIYLLFIQGNSDQWSPSCPDPLPS